MAQAEHAAGCVGSCAAVLTCLGRPCVLDLTLGLSQLDPIPPCLSDVSRVEHGGAESVCDEGVLSSRAVVTSEGEENGRITALLSPCGSAGRSANSAGELHELRPGALLGK